MPPIFSYSCDYCGHAFDKILYSTDSEVTKTQTCRCGSEAKKVLSIPAAARGNFGTTKRNAGQDPVQKFNFDEPTQEQLEFESSRKKDQ
jgi:putative FmdB family regulatory protein